MNTTRISKGGLFPPQNLFEQEDLFQMAVVPQSFLEEVIEKPESVESIFTE